MNEHKIFISVGGTFHDKQESFVRAIEERLKSENLIPNTVGRNTFSNDSPLKKVFELMDECSGTMIIALERTYFPSGIERRGGLKEASLEEIKFPTPWNQIEAAIAFAKGQPIMIIVEEGLKSEGLLEKGNDLYIMYVNPEISSLSTPEFNGVLSSWKKKVESYEQSKLNIEIKRNSIDPSTLTIGELLKNLKPADLWKILGALVILLTGAFTLGQFFNK